MDKYSRNYTKLAISQFMYQSSSSSSNGCFKTDNRSITTLIQGEVKYLNQINHQFLWILDWFKFIRHTIIILGLSIANFFSIHHTIKSNPMIPILEISPFSPSSKYP